MDGIKNDTKPATPLKSDSQKYPKRERFFAYRLTRLLTKTASAQELGPDGCWLVTIIAHQEDAKRYRGPVTFYNGQLMPLLGIASEATLTRLRKVCVAAGWLHYEPGAKRKPGRYWCMTPSDCENLPDTPTDEGNPEDFPFNNCGESEGKTGGNLKGKRRESEGEHGGPSTLTLNPSPNPNPKTNARSNGKDQISKQADEIYQAYPRKVGKQAAIKAIEQALRLRPFQELLSDVQEYADSQKDADSQFVPYPKTWFSQERWNDDQTEWKKRPSTRQRSAGETYNSDSEYRPEL